MTRADAHAAMDGELIVNVYREHGDWKVCGISGSTVDVWRWADNTKLVGVSIDKVHLKGQR